MYLVKVRLPSTWVYEINGNPAGTVNYLYSSSNEVEVGMEAGTEAEPENWGKAETAVEWGNETWHSWNKSTYQAVKYGGAYTNHVCVGPWGPKPGWVTFGTC
jgi:hypothetical protein